MKGRKGSEGDKGQEDSTVSRVFLIQGWCFLFYQNIFEITDFSLLGKSL
jgi:hypothetical protein